MRQDSIRQNGTGQDDMRAGQDNMLTAGGEKAAEVVRGPRVRYGGEVCYGSLRSFEHAPESTRPPKKVAVCALLVDGTIT